MSEKKKKTRKPEQTIPLDILREVRRAKKLSQDDIAEVLDIDRGTYARIEQGLSPLYPCDLIKLSKCLEVSVDFLLGLDTHVNKGNEEFMQYTGLNECSIETLRTLKQYDCILGQAQLIHLSLGGKPLTAFKRGNISVLNTLLANPDDFNTFATAFIHYATNEFIHPVHREKQKDGTGKWVPLNENEFGLCTDINDLEDSVSIKINEYNTMALHKNTLDILINAFAKAYKKTINKKVPVLEKSDTPK